MANEQNLRKLTTSEAREIGKLGGKSFNAIHDTNFEPKDITWNKEAE